MNGRTIARVLLLVVLIAGAIGLGVTAYDAGLSAGVAQNGNVVVAPGYPVAGYYGWGFGHGFGFFGFLGGLLFLFLLIALIRAAFGGPRRGWGGGWGGGHGHGWYPGGWRDEQGRTWEDRAREAHDAWHRDHPDDPNRPDRPAAG